MHPSRTRSGFTLIELLTVIAIIAILMGLLFPALNSAKNAAKKSQAKNDLTQFVTAVKAFETDYGVYPVDPTAGGGVTGNAKDAEFGDPGGLRPNSDVVNVLRADTTTADTISTSGSSPLSINTRSQIYLDVPLVKNLSNPQSGLGTGTETSTQNSRKTGGLWYDPWGGTYMIVIDTNYDGYTVANTLGNYSDVSYSLDPNNNKAIQTGAIGGSYGSDHSIGTGGNNVYTGSDDVLSWQ